MSRVNVQMGQNCQVADDASLEDVILGDRVVVRGGAQLRNVVVGSDTRIAREVTLYSPDAARPVRVGAHCWLSHGVFGEGTGGAIEIGDYTVLAHRCTLLTSSGPGAQSPIIDAFYPVELGDVTIGAHCWLGVNTVILPRAHLLEGCVVGANSLVRGGELPGWSVYGGNPVRRLKELDPDALAEARKRLEEAP